MKRIGKTLLTIGAAAAAALALGAFAPNAYGAAAPHPYTATCQIDGRTEGTPPLTCTLSPAPPPNVQTVIQSVDISLNQFETSSGIATPLYASLAGYSATGAVTFVPFTSTPTDPNTNAPAITAVWVAHELTAINVDPNKGILCNAVELNLHPDAILSCTVSGYFIPLQ